MKTKNFTIGQIAMLLLCAILTFVFMALRFVYIPAYRQMLLEFGGTPDLATEIASSSWFLILCIAVGLVSSVTGLLVASDKTRYILLVFTLLFQISVLLFFGYATTIHQTTVDSIMDG